MPNKKLSAPFVRRALAVAVAAAAASVLPQASAARFEYGSIKVELFLAFEAIGNSIESRRGFYWYNYLCGAS